MRRNGKVNNMATKRKRTNGTGTRRPPNPPAPSAPKPTQPKQTQPKLKPNPVQSRTRKRKPIATKRYVA